MPIVPIHNHTQYSSLDGLSTTVEIADRIEELGFEACGCTDHDVVAGHVDFYNTLSERGIKPLLGIEAYQARTFRGETHGKLKDKASGWKVDNFHLILLAMNNKGLKNLWRLNTESHRTGFYHHGRVDFQLLEQYNEGLICTSACVAGLMSQAIIGNDFLETPEYYLNKYREIFGDRFYLELSTYPVEEQRKINQDLCSLADTFGVPVVYANDAHYAKPGQYPLHEAILCLQYKQKIAELDKPHHEPALYIMNEEETEHELSSIGEKYLAEAMNNSVEIAKMCDVTLPERRFRIPIFISEDYSSNKEMLVDLVKQGYEKKVLAYPNMDKDEYWERLSKEMSVIYGANLVDYFLIVHDYVQYAKNKGIFVGPGRGSIGGSLVAFLIGITQVDPIRYGLIFERFYNAGRELSLPDIDIDFSTTGRDEIYQYISDKYGKDRVASICTLSKFQGQAAIKDMARVLGTPYTDTNNISKIIETTIESGLSKKTWEGIEEAAGKQLVPYKEKYPVLFDYASQIFRRIRQTSVHASGVIVGDESLDETFPLKWSASKKRMVTQWDMDVAEDFGFMKMDLLGLMNLNILGETNRILIEQGKKPINYEALQYQEHNDIYSLFQDGLTVGLFQVEDSGTAKSIAKGMRPKNVEDLAAVVALNRPGPLKSKGYLYGPTGLEAYMRGRNEGLIELIDPIYDAATAKTYGVLVYQEQIINYFVQIGYELSEADYIRKIVGKKKPKEMKEEFPRYLERASVHMSEATAIKIWDRIVSFAEYGFNLSHAVEYGIILLYCLYAKFHYPAEFLTAAIRCVTRDDKPKSIKYINEAQRMDFDVLLPDVNRSKAETHLDKTTGSIYLGLMNIQGIGKTAAQWVQDHAPYPSYEDFQSKIEDPNNRLWFKNRSVMPVNEGHIKALTNVGAFDSIQPRDITEEERLEFEEELLKVAISDKSAKILTEHSSKIERLCVPYDVVKENGEYRVAGVIKSLRKTKTKTGMDMQFVKIAQGADELDFAVWKNEIIRLEAMWQHRQAGIFHIKHTDRGNSLIGAECLT